MNPPPEIDWVRALSFLALGLGLGAALVWRVVAMSRSAKGPAPGDSVQVRDLEGKRDALVLQLREMEDTASKRTPEQLARERYALELEAAGVLLALDKGDPGRARPAKTAGSTAPAAGPALPKAAGGGERAGLRGFVWGTLSASALLLLGFFVYQSAVPRPTGGSVTGGPPMDSRENGGPRASAPAENQGDDEAEIRAALSRDPNDVEAHLRLARLHLSRQEMMEVWNESKWVLERAPGNPQALAYQALVRLAMGQGDSALELLEKAIANDPDLVDGYLYQALVYVRLGRPAEADAVITKASKRFPNQAADLQRLLSDLKSQGAAGGPPPAAGQRNPHSDPQPGTEPSATAAATSAPSGRRVSGTVDIEPSLLKGVSPGATVFVFVREAGFGAGPPVAATRLPAKFPARFELSESDAMMGQSFPDSLLIEARLDADGDPTTRPVSDPKARLDDVKAGRTDVRLVLR